MHRQEGEEQSGSVSSRRGVSDPQPNNTTYNATDNSVEYTDNFTNTTVKKNRLRNCENWFSEEHIITKHYLLNNRSAGSWFTELVTYRHAHQPNGRAYCSYHFIFIGIVLGALVGYFRGNVDALYYVVLPMWCGAFQPFCSWSPLHWRWAKELDRRL